MFFSVRAVSGYEPPKPTGAITGSSTFSAAGGVPKIVKGQSVYPRRLGQQRGIHPAAAARVGLGPL